MQQRIINFRQHIILKNISGAIILFAFLLSITPKQALHNLAAHHKDQSARKINDTGKLQFNEFGFNCDCNSIVATSPFTEIFFKPEIPKLIHFSFYRKNILIPLSSSDHFYFKLRGPPAVA